MNYGDTGASPASFRIYILLCIQNEKFKVILVTRSWQTHFLE